MTLSAITIENYRSVRDLSLPVEQLSIFVGANGVGKTNLYKALALLRHAADGTVTRAIAEEGGLESVLWAGPRSDRKPVRLVLKARFDELEYGVEIGLPHSYEVEIGLRQPTEAAFTLEPLVKEERLIVHQGRRDVVMMERKGPLVTLRNENGKRRVTKMRFSLRRPHLLRSATAHAIRSWRRFGARCWNGASIMISAPTLARRYANRAMQSRLPCFHRMAAIWQRCWPRCPSFGKTLRTSMLRLKTLFPARVLKLAMKAAGAECACPSQMCLVPSRHTNCRMERSSTCACSRPLWATDCPHLLH